MSMSNSLFRKKSIAQIQADAAAGFSDAETVAGDNVTLRRTLSTFDLTYFPRDRGPYNFNADPGEVSSDGHLLQPEKRWGGIMRPIEYSDFEQSNVEYIEFWVMDPFIRRPNGSCPVRETSSVVARSARCGSSS